MPLGRLHIVSVSLQTSDRRIRTHTFSDNDDDDEENHLDYVVMLIFWPVVVFQYFHVLTWRCSKILLAEV